MAPVVLLVGGPKDGERLQVAPEMLGRPLRFPVLLPATDFGKGIALPMAVAYDTVEYLPVSLAGRSERFTLYAVAGMSGDEVMGLLLAGYRTLKGRGE